MAIKLPAIFGEHMVLQQGRPIPVWGRAAPGEEVRVALAGQEVRGVTGPDGKWRVTLASLPAGGPFELHVTGREAVTVLKDVLVGEVWIASGQSNMEWPLSGALNPEQELAAARHDTIRLFTVAQTAGGGVADDVSGRWSVCAPDTARSFSAVAYFFGRELQRKLGVAVGLINCSWGGTMAAPWTSRAKLVSLPELKHLVVDYEKNLAHFERDNAAYQTKLKAGEEKAYPADPGNVGFGQGWAAPQTDLSDWGTMPVPSYWQGAGLDCSGVVWFRREIELPEAWAGRPLTLGLCACDKHDTTYFNNVQVGAMGRENPEAWKTPRVYQIPAGLARAGRNSIAVRVYSYAFAGGMMGLATDLHLGPADVALPSPIPLAGLWRYKVEHNFGKITPLSLQQPLGPGNGNSPYILFDGMVRPLIPFALRGAIWYQGESDADRAAQYRTLFPALIESWREAWGQGEFPFLFVQLASYMQREPAPQESAWAELREAQTATLRLPNTGMAVAIDVGAADDIHPKNKQAVGQRLAASALHDVYGHQDVVPSGPLYAGANIEGSAIRIRFQHIDGGLVAQGGELAGFAIAGQDRRFVWAEAKIEGDTVVVQSDQVPQPVAVRYAWANNPQANLSNQAGLPASPFRTDTWPRQP